ncbi:restriction endonuclease subunit S [Sphingobium ummariense]
MARRTEAPEGWKISLLDSVTKRGSGHTPDKEHPEYWNGGIKWVSLADSHRLDAGTISETDKEISELGIAKSSAVVHPSGTVILSRDAGVGKSAVLDGDMAVSQHFIAWRCSSSLGLHNWFLYMWLQFNKREFERQAVGSTIKTIGLPYFKRLQICYPPYAEQSAIVDIIRTWDRAIETVEALIANARAQKQALMQQLLPQGIAPPKKRLPGFSGEWRKLHIGDVAKEVSERPGEQAGYPVLSCSKYDGMVESLSYFKKKVYSDDTSNYKVMRRGTFGFPSNHVEEGSIGYQDLCDAGIVSPIYCVFATSNEVDDGFLYKLLKTDRYRQIFAAATNASVDRRGSLRWKEFSRIPLPLPPLEEQRAISEAVNAVASTEAAYRAQLTALLQEKAALMQQLLTGKRRVKLPESEVA